MTGTADTAVQRVTARVAFSGAVQQLRVRRRSLLRVGVAATVLILGLAALLVLGTRAAFGQDPFSSEAPRSDLAETLAGWSVVALLLAWSFVGSVAYGAFTLIAAHDAGDARGALSTSVRRLWRDVWWAPLAFLATAIAVGLVLPAILVVAPLAAISAARARGMTLTAAQLRCLFGRMCAVALIPTGLSGVCWGLAAVAAQFASPPPWGSALILTAGVSASLAAMALTAAITVPLLDDPTLPVAESPVALLSPVGQPTHAGWYPAEGWVLRWWDGTQWTDDRVVPIRVAGPRRGRLGAVGILLVVAPVATAAIAGVLLMGDPYPTSRVGVAGPGGQIRVVNATCPGERLTEIRLTRADPAGTGPVEVLWSATGDVALPAHFPLGDAPVGMVTTKPLVRALGPADELFLTVRTDQLDHPYPLEFFVRQVPETGVLGFDGVIRPLDQFEQKARTDVPCDDPYGPAWPDRVLTWWLISSAVLVSSGVVLLVLDRQVRRRRAAGGTVS